MLSCELHGSPITLSNHEAYSFRDILILIHLLHAGTFRLGWTKSKREHERLFILLSPKHMNMITDLTSRNIEIKSYIKLCSVNKLILW